MEHRQSVVAGVTTALVGFASSFAVVLAGLRAVGATPSQAASGLVALCVTQALGMLWLARRYKMPVTLAWSTPGAALLAGSAAGSGGWAEAVGAFMLVGLLMIATGLWTRLGDLVAAIPAPLAQAMLAGVLLSLCLAPATALADDPLRIAPVVVVWLVLFRRAPTWAVPAAFAVALVIVGVEIARRDGVAGALLPVLQLQRPDLSVSAVLGIALPLYVVTMASQNLPGAAVLASYGYRVPWRATMAVTGIGTLAGAPVGGHAVNLAAITAALSAAPSAHADPGQRWRAARAAAATYLVLAVLAGAITTAATAAPPGLLEAVAGLALMATLGSSLSAATERAESRLAAMVTLVVAASGIDVLGIGAAFWAIVVGLAVWAVTGAGQPEPARAG